MRLNMPIETGPIRIAHLDYLNYDELSDPKFRRLLAMFQTIPLR